MEAVIGSDYDAPNCPADSMLTDVPTLTESFDPTLYRRHKIAHSALCIDAAPIDCIRYLCHLNFTGLCRGTHARTLLESDLLFEQSHHQRGWRPIDCYLLTGHCQSSKNSCSFFIGQRTCLGCLLKLQELLRHLAELSSERQGMDLSTK